MTGKFSQPLKQQLLRRQAEKMLKEGSVQPTYGWLTSSDALSLLHKLASSPGSAADALKLLHELQVHQVELDIQHEQLEASERELTEDLIHCARLYDFAPVPYFSVSRDGKINRANIATAALFGEDHDGLIGRNVEDFLEPEGWAGLRKLVSVVRDGALDETCEVRTKAGASLHVKAGLIPGEPSILMVVVDHADTDAPAQPAAKLAAKPA
ncbi:MAG: PAS domain S-box protein [Woeseia sp.]